MIKLSLGSQVVMTFEEFKSNYQSDFEDEYEGNVSERDWQNEYRKYLNDYDEEANELLEQMM